MNKFVRHMVLGPHIEQKIISEFKEASKNIYCNFGGIKIHTIIEMIHFDEVLCFYQDDIFYEFMDKIKKNKSTNEKIKIIKDTFKAAKDE